MQLQGFHQVVQGMITKLQLHPVFVDVGNVRPNEQLTSEGQALKHESDTKRNPGRNLKVDLISEQYARGMVAERGLVYHNGTRLS